MFGLIEIGNFGIWMWYVPDVLQAIYGAGMRGVLEECFVCSERVVWSVYVGSRSCLWYHYVGLFCVNVCCISACADVPINSCPVPYWLYSPLSFGIVCG